MSQYALTFRTILKLSLPSSMLKATSDDAPETSSELRFNVLRSCSCTVRGGPGDR